MIAFSMSNSGVSNLVGARTSRGCSPSSRRRLSRPVGQEPKSCDAVARTASFRVTSLLDFLFFTSRLLYDFRFFSSQKSPILRTRQWTYKGIHVAHT